MPRIPRRPARPFAALVLTAVLATFGPPALTATAAPAPTAAGPAREVLVILRDQHPVAPAGAADSLGGRRTQVRAAQIRADQLHGDQAAVLAQLPGRDATAVHHYVSTNAVSMTVTTGQVAELQRDPAVASVVPNVRISVPTPTEDSSLGGPGAAASKPAVPAKGACPANPQRPLLEPEALTDTHTASTVRSDKVAQDLVSGYGVKVGYIADAIDPTNPDLIRPNGGSVISDYKSFSADGPTPDQGGAEAYGDASAIGAQGRQTYDLSNFVNPAYALPKGCTIRIRGMAPGADIVALKTDFSTVSIVQAIDYAVSTAHVDVLNESFGGNVIPDSTVRGAIQLFNDQAVAAGTTVTVSSGDAGTTSTIGNPAADPKVISVAASTNSRGYAQTGYGAFTFSNKTWINDEISSLSSGGTTQGGATVDLTAPGEVGWALCDTRSPECTNYRGGTSPIQLFGGTSQSAPLTAGAAALVIQAYRRAHSGTTPSPALVKHLLTSTASDLGLPAYEQGSGLLNTRSAVEAAMTYRPTGTPHPGLGSNLVISTGQFDISGAPGSSRTLNLGVRNVGQQALTVGVTTRDYAAVRQSSATANLAATKDPTFPYPTSGLTWAYKKVSFTVPDGTDRLAARMIWNGAAKKVGASTVTPVVRVTLLNPNGRYVANSRPQGGTVSANYANLDVRFPKAGTWTAVLYTPASTSGYSGRVTLQTTDQRIKSVGTVSPATRMLAPGRLKTFRVRATLPASGGDATQSIVVSSSNGKATSVPIVERAIVPTGTGVGHFSGTITGGNGRAGAPAQSFTYGFDVPSGERDLDVGVTLATNPKYLLEGVLVDPNDETQSVGTNGYSSAAGKRIASGRTMQLTTAGPIPGRWRLVILVVGPVPGTQLVENFSGTVAFDKVKVTASGLPDSTSTTRPAGTTGTAKVTVTNTGIAPINVQADPRTTTVRDTPLTSPFGSQTVKLPGGSGPTFIVPPGTTGLTAVASSSVPAIVELTPATEGIDAIGDIHDAQGGSTVSVAGDVHTTGTVSTGVWFTGLDNAGYFSTAGGSGSGRVNLSARTPGFDPDTTTSTGDYWALALDPTADTGTPVTIQPGKSAVITVRITPTAPSGTAVAGVLNIYTTPSTANASFATTGDVLASIPYSYTVG